MNEIVHGRRKSLESRYKVTEGRYKLDEFFVVLYAQLLLMTAQIKYQYQIA